MRYALASWGEEVLCVTDLDVCRGGKRVLRLIGRAMLDSTLLHCNGLAMPDLKFVYRSGHALLNHVCVCLYASLQWSGHA